MRNKTIVLLLALCIIFICGCEANETSHEESKTSLSKEEISTDISTDEGSLEEISQDDSNSEDSVVEESIVEETVDNPAWDDLFEMGKVLTESGLSFVEITLPSGFMGSNFTQAEMDAKFGSDYISCTMDENGARTYKLTKKQHKNMLEAYKRSMEQVFANYIEDPKKTYTRFDYNDDLTVFDVYVDTENVGFSERFYSISLYMYNGYYNCFCGKGESEKVTVNYYNCNNELVYTTSLPDED